MKCIIRKHVPEALEMSIEKAAAYMSSFLSKEDREDWKEVFVLMFNKLPINGQYVDPMFNVTKIDNGAVRVQRAV